MQPSNVSSSQNTHLEELMTRNYDQTQEDMRKLRAALRKLYSKIEKTQALIPNDPEQFTLRSVTPQEKIQIIRYVRENVERFNEATERLTSIHQDLQGWKDFRSELQEIKEQLKNWQKSQVTNTLNTETQDSKTMVP